MHSQHFQAGEGQQWVSWVGRDEKAAIIEFAMRTESLAGPVNAASPNPLRNADFARTASQALGQKWGGVMPTFLVRLTLGEMGEALVLASRRLYPAKLLASDYQFRFPDLEAALQHETESLQAGFASQPA